MTELAFTVLGRPISQPRPRVTRRGTFMPARYAAYKVEMAEAAQVAAYELECRGQPWDATKGRRYRVRARFYLPWESSDTDKLVATVLDALEYAGVYESDRQVVSIRADREVDKAAPRAEVTVEVIR